MIASKASRGNGKVPEAGQGAEQAGRDHAVVLGRQRLHVEGDDALCRDAGRVHRPRSDRRWRRRAFPFRPPRTSDASRRSASYGRASRGRAAWSARPPSVRRRARCRLRPAPASATAPAPRRPSAAASRHNRSSRRCAARRREPRSIARASRATPRASTIQSASTPPPCPPIASTATRSAGRSIPRGVGVPR